MNTEHTIRRRSVLSGLPLAAVAASLPALATDPPAPPSPVPDLISAYRAARETLSALLPVHEAKVGAVTASLEAEPIMVHLPGLRFTPQFQRWEKTSKEQIERLYQSYDLLSGKFGVRLAGDGKYEPIDATADRQRDLALALQSFEEGGRAFVQRGVDMGEEAAGEACEKAWQAVDDAWLALLAYPPRTPFEAAEKATAIWSVVAENPDFFDTAEHLKVLLGSMGASLTNSGSGIRSGA